MKLADKTIVILGGSSGIGLATAEQAMAEGARVIITGRNRDTLDGAAARLGNRVRAVALDSSDEAGMRKLFDDLESVDHIFSNAGSVVRDAKLTADIATMRGAMDVRFWGAVYAAKFAAPKMREGGSIVIMSGTSAVRPIPGAAIGSASCSAVEGLARSLAVDLAPIRVNAIRPGLIDTPLVDRLAGPNKDALIKTFVGNSPAKRAGRADEVADAVLFLMKNEYVTGTTLIIDGGASLT